jgi:hypothetical protein
MMTKFWDFIDDRFVIRRVMTLGTFAMTVYVIWWATEFATTSARAGADIAMIIGAIGVPLNTLMGYLFSAYNTGRSA